MYSVSGIGRGPKVYSRKNDLDINLINSSKCLFCNEIDTIRHFLLFCQKVHYFFNSFFQSWNRMGDLEILVDYDFLEEYILFGFHLKGGSLKS